MIKNKQNEDKKLEETKKEEKTSEKEPETEGKKEPSLETKSENKKELKESEKLKNELVKSNEKTEELTDMLKRLQAEFENYKKRVEKDNKRLMQYAGANIIGKILPIIDTFEIAIKDECNFEKFKEGTKLIYAELMNILKSEGAAKIEALGKPFDSNLHDAMFAVEAKDCEKDTVIEVLQEGYMLKDKVLRHSKVKISKS